MFDRLKRLLGLGKPAPESDEDPEGKLSQAWQDQKSKLMEGILGREHDMVMHAIFPYAVGGGLDLYYYPHGVPGTAVGTKELSDIPNQGAKNKVFSCYELAMFTRHPINLDLAHDEAAPFGRAHQGINRVLNLIARYSAQAQLNPNETCEFPAEMEKVGGKCLIFDACGPACDIPGGVFGVMSVIEIHRSEMEFARAAGGAQLIAKLNHAGHYPYSDLDRDPVA